MLQLITMALVMMGCARGDSVSLDARCEEPRPFRNDAVDASASPSTCEGGPTTFDSLCERAETLLRRGEVRPTHREIQSALVIGKQTVVKILQRLVETGVLWRVGNRYQVLG